MANFSRIRDIVTGAAAGALLVAGLSFFAAEARQVHPQPLDRMMGPGGMKAGPRDPAEENARCDTFEANEAGTLAFARARLKITEAQAAAWMQFETAVKAAEAPIDQLCRVAVGSTPPTTLPQRLALWDGRAAAETAHTHGLRVAVDQLYPLLTDAQKKIADDDLDHGAWSGGRHEPGFGPMPYRAPGPGHFGGPVRPE